METWRRSIKRWWSRLQERRQCPRTAGLPLSASYWVGGYEQPRPVVNVSYSGVFVDSPESWCVGTVMDLCLQESEANLDRTFRVRAEVVRLESDGMAMQFMTDNSRERRKLVEYLDTTAKRHRHATRERGSSLVEFALILPLLTLLAVNMVNFGAFFFAWITIANAARTASQYAAMAGATVTSPTPATAGQVAAVVAADISSLMNNSSLAVRVCTRNGATVACTTSGTGSFTDPPADARAEASSYVMQWVDVKYTYQPVIPLFRFPGLGINATLPTTTLHRQTVMRMLQ
jgi:Flp pilus assembly protein TadG